MTPALDLDALVTRALVRLAARDAEAAAEAARRWREECQALAEAYRKRRIDGEPRRPGAPGPPPAPVQRPVLRGR